MSTACLKVGSRLWSRLWSFHTWFMKHAGNMLPIVKPYKDIKICQPDCCQIKIIWHWYYIWWFQINYLCFTIVLFYSIAAHFLFQSVAMLHLYTVAITTKCLTGLCRAFVFVSWTILNIYSDVIYILQKMNSNKKKRLEESKKKQKGDVLEVIFFYCFFYSKRCLLI